MIKTISISQFKTDSGVSYETIDLHYQHFGQDYNDAPVVLINHSLTGDANVAGPLGWWNEIVGPNLTIDTNQFAIIAFNIPGNGIKDSVLENYLDFHTGDIAEIFYSGLKKLGVTHLFALLGGSIGGGIAWEMSARYPELTDNLIPVASDWKASDWIIANTFLQKRLLENSKDPVQDARIHAMLTYRTPASFSSRFNRTKNNEKKLYNVESWLAHHGKKLFNRFTLEAYKSMNHLLSSVDISRNGKDPKEIIENIKADIHIIAIDSDIFFTPDEDQKTFQLVKDNKENIFYHEIKSIHGHDAFLIENEIVSKILSKIFNHELKIKKKNERSYKE